MLHARMALFTFNRPPVTLLPDSAAIGSTLPSKLLFKAAVSRDGQLESTSAAAPETWGVAIDVPLKKE